MAIEQSHAPVPQRKSLWLIGVMTAVWLAAATGGLYVVWAYDNAPGLPADAGPSWPQSTTLVRATDRPTVVMLAHPLCDCTRASLAELAEALGRTPVKPKTYVVFLKPTSMPDGWEQSGLWKSAEQLPDTTIVRDDDGLEAERFGALTSGQTMVYDAQGALRFSGGITGARAHEGDNAGRSAVVALLNALPNNHAATHVYGCSLFASAKS
jgi:hypothetical protein